MKQPDLERWALIGARERLMQLAAEAAAFYKAFPLLLTHAIGFGKRAGGRQSRKPGVRSQTKKVTQYSATREILAP
ncbi:MAG TPA: hypothetical protein VL484_14560 [Vicinamibacterales bacterium]|jgi:hypothetical protein|nr:hypothetical protein [Vicinamibacterales bacterium]